MKAAGFKIGGGGSQPVGAWGKGSGVSNPWAPPGEDESIDSLQTRTAMHETAIDASLGRTLKLAQTTHETGAETLRALHAQGEQLKSIKGHQAAVESNLKTSDKLLRGMESWRGGVANWVAGRFSKDESKRSVIDRSADPESPRDDDDDPSESLSTWPSKPRAAAMPAGASREQDPMSQISSLVSGLRLQAETMNAELKAQSGELDRINDRADSNATHLANTNARAKKLGR